MLLLDKNTGFRDWGEYVDESWRDIVVTDPNDYLAYPISYLQDALHGISKSELVVIGADTGIGKTECANNIAFHNAQAGKNVYLFSLEGDKYDVVQRKRYKNYVNMVTSSGNKHKYNTDYRSYLLKQYAKNGSDVQVEMMSELANLDTVMKNKYRNLKIYGREDALSIDTLTGHMELIKDDCDLVVIDHLQYFDFHSNNEHAEITEIMKQIQRLKSKYRIPVVLVSHLRKKNNDRLFPDNNDFHGSSNIPKQADVCIILSHLNFEGDNYEDQIHRGVYQTGIRITKNRSGMSQRIVGVVDFDLNVREYSNKYQLAVCLPHEIRLMDKKKYPKWACKYMNGTYVPKYDL